MFLTAGTSPGKSALPLETRVWDFFQNGSESVWENELQVLELQQETTVAGSQIALGQQFEVEADHHYFVGSQHLLVHNDNGYVTSTIEGGFTQIKSATNPDTFIQGKVTGDNLFINMYNVAIGSRGQGVSTELIQQMLSKSGNVESVSGEMAFSNDMAIKDALDQGDSLTEAVAQTPFAKSLAKFGYTSLEYDSETGILTASKPK